MPADRVRALAAEMATCNRGEVRLALRRCFDYLDRHGTLAGGLCRSGVNADVVFGDNDDVGLTGQERAALESARRPGCASSPAAAT